MSDKPTVTEFYECPECGGKKWYLGYDKTDESIHECTECGYVGTP